MTQTWSILLNSSILGAVLTAVIWIVLRLTPRRALNATTRHAIWWMVLAATIALPLSKVPIPKSRPLAGRPAATAPVPQSEDGPIVRPPSPVLVETPQRADVPEPSAFTVEVPVAAERWLFALAAAWLAASTFTLGRLMLDYAALRRLKSRAIDAPIGLCARADRWLVQCRLRRAVRLAISEEIEIPIATGPWHPSILLPAHFLEDLEKGVLSDAELDQIGLHESAHLSRYDDYGLLVQRIVEAVLVLHPVARWITSQIDLEREIACDDFVICSTSRPERYASCLTRIAENSVNPRSAFLAAPVADDLLSLTRRIELLLDRTRHTGTRILRGRLGSMTAIVVLACVAMANMRGILALSTPLVTPAVSFLRRVPGIALAPQTSVTPAAGRKEQERGPTGEPEGRVVEDSSGAPLASAEIRFRRTGMRELAADLETDREGVFRASGLPPGDYAVEVTKPNFVPASFPFRAPGRLLSIRLTRYGVIDGQATDDAGRPLQGRIISTGGWTAGSARIAILAKTPGSAEFHLVRQVEIHEAGRYRVYDLTPGEYEVGLWYSGLSAGAGIQLYPDNSRPRLFTVAGGEEYRDVNFAVTPQVSYHVAGKIALPKARDRFAVSLGVAEQPALPLAHTWTEPDGSFRFESIPGGVYELFVAGPTTGYSAYDSMISSDEPLFGRTRVQVTGQNVDGLDIPVSPGRSFNAQLRAADSDTAPPGCPQTARVTVSSLEPWGVIFESDAQIMFGAPKPISKIAPGKFGLTLSGLGPGCYQVRVPVVDLNNSVPDPVAVEVAAAGGIQGALSPAALAGDFVVVLVDAERTTSVPTRVAFPGSEGKFHFDAVPPGRYRIAAQSARDHSQARWVGGLPEMTEIEVPGGKPISISLPIPREPGARP